VPSAFACLVLGLASEFRSISRAFSFRVFFLANFFDPTIPISSVDFQLDPSMSVAFILLKIEDLNSFFIQIPESLYPIARDRCAQSFFIIITEPHQSFPKV